MAEFENRYDRVATAGTRVDQAAIDAGLRKYMMNVYNYMALGVGFAAVVSLLVMNFPPLLMAMAGGFKWVAFIAVLGLGWFAPRLMLTGNAATAHAAYWSYCALWGLIVAPMVFFFLSQGLADVVARAFAITAVTFGAVSLFGYTTKKDLSGVGSFLAMASIGLLIVFVIQAVFFSFNETFSLLFSCAVVLIFAGITAWETQEIKQMYLEGEAEGAQNGKAIFGAFMLFGSFITLFIHILNILGIMGGDE